MDTQQAGFNAALSNNQTKTMGNFISSEANTTGTIDGLGLKAHGIGPRPESKQKLIQYLKGNNRGYGFLFNNRKFHNHLPHHLISAYFLGATPQQLSSIFEEGVTHLTPWKEDSPSVVIDEELKSHLGEKRYERGFFDYFTDKLEVDTRTDWYSIARHFLIDQELIYGLTGGLLHPLIHLGYAVESEREEVAVEALGMTCTEWIDSRQIISGDGKNIAKAEYGNALEIIQELHDDEEVARVPYSSLKELLLKTTKIGNYYVHRFDAETDTKKALQDLLYIGALMLSASRVSENGKPEFNFFLLHILTGAHAVTELISSRHNLIPRAYHAILIREYWLSALGVYFLMGLPQIDPSRIEKYPIESVQTAWERSIGLALTGEKKFDDHYIKAIRSLLVAETFNEDTTGFYAKAALMFATEFIGQSYARDAVKNRQ